MTKLIAVAAATLMLGACTGSTRDRMLVGALVSPQPQS
jgi:hypothetical protein